MRIVVGFFFICLLSCKDKFAVPKGIIPLKKMEKIMWDVVRADMMVNYYSARDTAYNKTLNSTTLYQQIFKIHNISKQEFEKSVNYYQSRPDLLQPVFDTLYSKASTPELVPVAKDTVK